MIYVGIDPGVTGGLAWVDSGGGEMEASALPKTETDIWWLFHALPTAPQRYCLIEKVHSMPAQGVASSFKFGRNYGFLRGLLVALKIPFDEVIPQRWQKAMGCLSGGDKNVTKQKAQQLFPGIKVTHATADALLIAEYCRRTHGK